MYTRKLIIRAENSSSMGKSTTVSAETSRWRSILQQGRSQDFQEGGFQIGSNENGWSKILTFTGIESPLHSCWDKITVKNRRGGGGVPWRERGVPEPLEPSPGYAPVQSEATVNFKVSEDEELKIPKSKKVANSSTNKQGIYM